MSRIEIARKIYEYANLNNLKYQSAKDDNNLKKNLEGGIVLDDTLVKVFPWKKAGEKVMYCSMQQELKKVLSDINQQTQESELTA